MNNPGTEKTSEKVPQIEAVERWLKDVVIGLNLCPFAARPFGDKAIRIEVFEGDTETGLLEMLQSELILINDKPIVDLTTSVHPTKNNEASIETTLIVIPNMLHNFDTYNQFLNLVDALLDEFSWAGQYQIASFHPQYCFAGTAPDSPENLTNRSPYPLLHIIREASIETALQH
ncbi:MAG: DUF1415 domain-containing protein, partial [Gammaproteobacteria bacterium]